MFNVKNDCDIVISTHIHLFRNLEKFPFLSRTDHFERQNILNTVHKAINSNDILLQDLNYIDIEKIETSQKVSFVEQSLISAEFLSCFTDRNLYLNKSNTVSLMVNEDDHLHLQTVCNGLNLDKAYNKADKIETVLGKPLDFAFDINLGYLTHSPINIGTGMRASVILHLPALKESGGIERISSNLSKLGFALRNIYSTNLEFEGGIYQLSNQVTLGITEKEAISNLGKIAAQIINQERLLEEKLSQNIEIQDLVSRSFAVLKSAVLMSNREFLKLISNVRLGVSTGLIADIDYYTINRLITEVQPATLISSYSKALTTKERRLLRAKKIKEIINNV